jgi:hypothetical protein
MLNLRWARTGQAKADRSKLASSPLRISADSHRVSSRRMDDRQLRERTIKHIQDAVAQMFGLSVEELRTESRSRNVAFRDTSLSSSSARPLITALVGTTLPLII